MPLIPASYLQPRAWRYQAFYDLLEYRQLDLSEIKKCVPTNPLFIQLPSYRYQWNIIAFQISNKRAVEQPNKSIIPYMHM